MASLCVNEEQHPRLLSTRSNVQPAARQREVESSALTSGHLWRVHARYPSDDSGGHFMTRLTASKQNGRPHTTTALTLSRPGPD